MSTCEVDNSDHKHNGLITKIWGEPTWESLHSITFGYPIEPTEQQRREYREYFIALANVLPCKYCRESYKQFITEGDTALTNEVFTSRATLTKWLYNVHEAVNNKLEIDYGITYEEIVDRYESFRAKCGKSKKTEKGCVAPLDYKAMSFKKLYQRDCPIVSLEKITPFITLAKLRGLNENDFYFLPLAQQLKGDFVELKKQECWTYRNKYCYHIIKEMRINGTPSVEPNGPWAGTPTIDELKLLMYLCSNLNRTELAEATAKLLANSRYNKELYY